MSVDDELERIKLGMMKHMMTLKPPITNILRPGEIVDLSDANFHAALSETDKPVLVDFWAEWCAPCRMMAPVVHLLASEMKDHAYMAKLNVDESPRTAAQFGVMSIPNFIVFKRGRPFGQIVGAVGKPSLMQLLRRNIP